MAKGQMRSNKEKKKPKADHNKKQKGAPPRAASRKRNRRPERSRTRALKRPRAMKRADRSSAHIAPRIEFLVRHASTAAL